jgi:hypothetical protein
VAYVGFTRRGLISTRIALKVKLFKIGGRLNLGLLGSKFSDCDTKAKGLEFSSLFQYTETELLRLTDGFLEI